METFLFGPGERLFGAYYEGLGPPVAPAVLICNGLGQDYMRSHLVLRQLARQLSAVGGPVLQFDYRGTGDSWGEPEGNSLAQLREDAAIALQELVEISARPRAVIIGVRLGAWLALELGERVVAWDPPLSGDGYVRALRALANQVCEERGYSTVTSDSETHTGPELAGYRYAMQLLDEVSMLNLQRIVDGRHFERLALITGEDADGTEVAGTLETSTDSLDHYPAPRADWDKAAQLERSLTPFPSLTKVCETVKRW